MSPEEMMDCVTDLPAIIAAKVEGLAGEARRVAGQWEELGRLSAQRADHAADLLANLLPQLRELARFAGACAEQIERARQDPLGRQEHQAKRAAP